MASRSVLLCQRWVGGVSLIKNHRRVHDESSFSLLFRACLVLNLGQHHEPCAQLL